MGSTDKSRDPAALFQLLASFTNDGTPLEALLGSKVEWGVTVLTAGMLANENLAASTSPEEMVDGAINYYNLIQERLAYYRSNQVHSLEKMIDKWLMSGDFNIEEEPILFYCDEMTLTKLIALRHKGIKLHLYSRVINKLEECKKS